MSPRRRGSLQLVFCDIGTPGDDWNVYDELRDQLTARGLPRDAIRFVHDAKTDRDKGELFAACILGYKNHSPVSKRLARIRRKAAEYFEHS